MNLIALPKFVTKVSDQGAKRNERERGREKERKKFFALAS